MVWRLFRDLDRLRDQLQRPLAWRSLHNPGDPAVNVYETPEEFVAQFEVPGAEREKFDVSFTAGVLKILGEYRVSDVAGALLRSELPEGPFQRAVRLSDDVDPGKLNASYENGVLTVRLAKSEAARPRRIEVKMN
ncbi:MAG: Hsp20/alpha crystallin family protein [Planctomycetota bacterium]